MRNHNHETNMKAALADLDTQLNPNYTATAKKFDLERTTLAKRHQGQTVSIKESRSTTHQRLTGEQEEALIEHINRLSKRGIPPTSQMTRNIAEEMIGSVVGKNWTSDFARRHKARLTSKYLRNIDILRKNSETHANYKHYFDLVSNVSKNIYGIVANNNKI